MKDCVVQESSPDQGGWTEPWSAFYTDEELKLFARQLLKFNITEFFF